MTKENNFLAYLYLFLTVTFWAGNFVVGKLASFYEVPPFSLNFYRWLFAWLILAPFTIPEILEKRKYIMKNYKLFIILGVTSITIFNSIVYYSLNFTQVISGVLMISTIPVMIMLFSSILKIEKTNIRKNREFILAIARSYDAYPRAWTTIFLKAYTTATRLFAKSDRHAC